MIARSVKLWLFSGFWLCALAAGCGAAVARADWPAFRGPLGNGSAPGGEIPLRWSESSGVAWKLKLPGSGWSQPVAVGDTVYVTCAVSEGAPAPKRFLAGLMDPRSRPRSPPLPADFEIEWRVLAIDLADGAIRWQRTAHKGKPAYAVHPSNTYATETPYAHERGVAALFGPAGLLVALAASGETLWEKRLGELMTFERLGTASSLAGLGDRLFLQCFDEKQAWLGCYDLGSGAELWKSSRQLHGTSWSTPLVWRNRLRTEVVAAGQKLITSHQPETGEVLWQASGAEAPTAASLAADDQAIYFGHRSPLYTGPLFALPAGLEGEHVAQDNGKSFAGELWSQAASAPGLSSPLAAGGYVHCLHSSILSCYSAATGERVYRKRLPRMGPVTCALVSAGDRLLVLDESGRALVLRIGPQFEVLGEGKLDDLFWASPAITSRGLLLRGAEHLYCVRP